MTYEYLTYLYKAAFQKLGLPEAKIAPFLLKDRIEYSVNLRSYSFLLLHFSTRPFFSITTLIFVVSVSK